MKISHFTDENRFWTKALEVVLETIAQTLKVQPFFTLGLAGGSTPKKLYQMLASKKLTGELPWTRIRLIIIDERYVPLGHPEGNGGMIRQALTAHIPIPPENFIVFDTSLPLESAAQDMEKKLKFLQKEAHASNRPLFDLLLLGAGSDGHIASLFEKDATLDQNHLTSATHAAGHPIETRLTLTLKALTDAREALLLLVGKKKAPVLEHMKNPTLPLGALSRTIPFRTFTLNIV